ncbi:MAG: T9SS type A sorting domain-containing protein, partial [Bacteroidales bacterium]|nr:T9SS type A sorting domain-containing protein [Bacteroidales bacterium]
NPVEINLFIEYPWTKISLVEIVDMSGKTVYKETNFSANSINVSELNAGFYLLKMVHNDQFVIRRFVKK